MSIETIRGRLTELEGRIVKLNRQRLIHEERGSPFFEESELDTLKQLYHELKEREWDMAAGGGA